MTDYADSRGVTPAQRSAYASRTQMMIRLYDLRDATGLAPEAFAERIGVTAEDVDRVEQGDFEGVTVEVLDRYAHAVGDPLTISAGADVPPMYTLTDNSAVA